MSLADGSFHTVRNFSTEPTLVSDGADDLSSEAVSKTARSVFIKVEEDDMTRLDVNTIQGMVSYDDDAFCTWIHEYATKFACLLECLLTPSSGPFVPQILATSTTRSTLA